MEKVIAGNKGMLTRFILAKFDAYKFHRLFLAKLNAYEFQRLLQFTKLLLEKLENFGTHENLLPQKQIRLKYN